MNSVTARKLGIGAAAIALGLFGLSARQVRAQNEKQNSAQRILFVSDRDKADAFAIYAMNPDGTGQTRLTKGDVLAFDPAWSPDQKHILYTVVTEKDSPKTALYVMKADGSDPSPLVQSGEKTVFLSPSWSPDGKHIAVTEFVLGGDKPETHILTMDADGKNRKKIADGVVPAWSPDSKHLLFSDYSDGIPALKSIDLDGSNGKDLGVKGAAPAWSPNGKQIAYIGSGDNAPAIFTMDPDGTHVTRLTKDTETIALGPTWTPDGKAILFTRLPKANPDGKPKMQICRMDADGSNVKTVVAANAFIGSGTSMFFVAQRAGAAGQ